MAPISEETREPIDDLFLEYVLSSKTEPVFSFLPKRHLPILTQPIIFANVTRFVNAITLNSGLGSQSYKFALVRSKGEIGKPIKAEIETVTPKDVEANYGTFYAAGADTVFLLSNKSNKNVDFF